MSDIAAGNFNQVIKCLDAALIEVDKALEATPLSNIEDRWLYGKVRRSRDAVEHARIEVLRKMDTARRHAS